MRILHCFFAALIFFIKFFRGVPKPDVSKIFKHFKWAFLKIISALGGCRNPWAFLLNHNNQVLWCCIFKLHYMKDNNNQIGEYDDINALIANTKSRWRCYQRAYWQTLYLPIITIVFTDEQRWKKIFLFLWTWFFHQNIFCEITKIFNLF